MLEVLAGVAGGVVPLLAVLQQRQTDLDMLADQPSQRRPLAQRQAAAAAREVRALTEFRATIKPEMVVPALLLALQESLCFMQGAVVAGAQPRIEEALAALASGDQATDRTDWMARAAAAAAGLQTLALLDQAGQER